MKKIMVLVLLIIFSSFFLINPRQTKGATCGKSCIDNSECSEATDGCTLCQQTEMGSGFGGCESGVCHCINPEDQWENEQENQNEEEDEEETKVITTSDLTTKVNEILKYAMGVGGVIAFILIIIGAFQIILSAGNPDRVKAGKEMITSAMAGLFLIVFAVLILRIIGVDILQIPGFK